MQLKDQILAAWDNRELLKDNAYADAVRAVIEEVDKGRLRVAEKAGVSLLSGCHCYSCCSCSSCSCSSCFNC